jgi:peroxiredoxin Q/BCP
MEINSKAPSFTLPDENGNPVSLDQFRGQNVVLFFYPRADTPGCTIEACGFRDAYKKLQKAGLVVLGISPDTPKAQLTCRIPCWPTTKKRWPRSLTS